MLKIILLVILVAAIFTAPAKLGALFRTVKKLPDDYRRGKAESDDPVAAAKDITNKKS